jgi:hypothetical protein
MFSKLSTGTVLGIFMNQKNKQQRFLKYLWLLHTLKVYIFIKIQFRSQTSESDQKGPDLDLQHGFVCLW